MTQTTGLSPTLQRPAGKLPRGNYEYGKKVVRFLDEPRLGLLTNMYVYGGFKVSERLRVLPSLRYQKMNERDHYLVTHPDEPRTLYEHLIFRTRFNYQLTREWFLRLIVEYRDFNTAGQPNRLFVEPLLTYRINPFTKFYVGANWGGRHFNEAYGFTREIRHSDGTIEWQEDTWDQSTWRLSQAQVFAKFQYLFRL